LHHPAPKDIDTVPAHPQKSAARLSQIQSDTPAAIVGVPHKVCPRKVWWMRTNCGPIAATWLSSL